MRVFYLNDESIPLTVQTRRKNGEPWEWDFTVLAPQEARIFDIHEVGTVPWLKRWDGGILMISCISSQTADDAALSLERQRLALDNS